MGSEETLPARSSGCTMAPGVTADFATSVLCSWPAISAPAAPRGYRIWPPRQSSAPDPAGCRASAASHRSWSSSPRARPVRRRSRCYEGDKSLHHVFLNSNLRSSIHERNVRDAEIRRRVTCVFGLNAVPRDPHELAEELLVRAVKVQAGELEA